MQYPVKPKEKLPIVYTSKAKCRDCYRCVRVCPVNAIRMQDGQAQVISERCIACGTCINECPQQAKAYRTDYGKVLQMMGDGDMLYLSIAPSFVSYYNEWEQLRLASAVRMLGFKYVAETAIGAWHTAIATEEYIKSNPDKTHICSACPALVSYIQQKAPHLNDMIVPVVSPMVAHGRILKSKNKNIKVVFVGPCVAKKDEMQMSDNEKYIDAVLTFEELDELFRLKNIKIESCEESAFDEAAIGNSRFFPLEGGLLKTANITTDLLDTKVIAISGYKNIANAINYITEIKGKEAIVLEPLFCKNGCVNGPFVSKKTNSFLNRTKVLHYANNNEGVQLSKEKLFDKMITKYILEKNVKTNKYTEAQIKEILSKTGKLQASDELNCTSCGYNSCRDKAIAVLDGIAEVEMCLPYMRRLAEQRIDTIITHDPNGIVLLNNKLEILHINAAFKKMFSCSENMIGKKINYLIDPDIFERLSTSQENSLRQVVQYSIYKLVCHLIVYKLPEEKNMVGIFVDITDSTFNKEKLTELKLETILKAQELMEHQINMAQNLAEFLGESTATGEVLMKNLIESIKK